MESAITRKNWEPGQTPEVFKHIHEGGVNITIFDRDIIAFREELDYLHARDIEFRSSGDIDTIFNAITCAVDLIECPLIQRDISNLLHLFSEVANAKSYRLFFASVNTNMCRRFHTDINDLRMLCTYKGPGTLWLTEDNVNRDALDCCDNDCLVIDESRIQQVKAGSVVILKGAIYPKKGTKGIVHRSPTIEESEEKRLLLRIDTDEFANF